MTLSPLNPTERRMLNNQNFARPLKVTVVYSLVGVVQPGTWRFHPTGIVQKNRHACILLI